jgi:glycosyltransferase involved in cell wall biosynthesis
MTHPCEWPELCNEFPVVAYLQHSTWANDVYRPFFGDRCRIWPVGIETDRWRPEPGVHKDIDLLIYDKVRWNREQCERELIEPIEACLAQRGLTTATIRYLHYGRDGDFKYRSLLARSRAMLFLCENESQGFAYQECLSCDVPVLAWDQGFCLDPQRFSWGQPVIPATSVPFFDDRCGVRFQSASDFPDRLTEFLDRLSARQFQPRQYVLESLTLEKAAAHFLEICRDFV